MSFWETVEKDAGAAMQAVRDIFKTDAATEEQMRALARAVAGNPEPHSDLKAPDAGAAARALAGAILPAVAGDASEQKPLPTPKAPDAGKAEVISL